MRIPPSLAMPPSPGVMVVARRSVAAAYPPFNPRALTSEVVPPMKTPELSFMLPAPGVVAAIDSAVVVETFPSFFPQIVCVTSVPSQTNPSVTLHSPPFPPRYARRMLLPCLSPAFDILGGRRQRFPRVQCTRPREDFTRDGHAASHEADGDPTHLQWVHAGEGWACVGADGDFFWDDSLSAARFR